MSVREPVLRPVPIADLRPTQITVGMREVEAKRRAWRARMEKDTAAAGSDSANAKSAQKARDKAGEFLGRHAVPIIKGPNARYVIDHHHLCRALHEEGQETVLVNIVADLSALSIEDFWFNMDCRGWMHPFDETGKRRDYESIPKTMAGLKDDPYRSLAGELRFAGGFAKDITPFSEFLWAGFLRNRIKAKTVEADFDAALAVALNYAKGQDAAYLPGWCGPSRR